MRKKLIIITLLFLTVFVEGRTNLKPIPPVKKINLYASQFIVLLIPVSKGIVFLKDNLKNIFVFDKDLFPMKEETFILRR